MSNVMHLFDAFKCELETMHGIAVEGHSEDPSDEFSRTLMSSLCDGLHKCEHLITEISNELGPANDS